LSNDGRKEQANTSSEGERKDCHFALLTCQVRLTFQLYSRENRLVKWL